MSQARRIPERAYTLAATHSYIPYLLFLDDDFSLPAVECDKDGSSNNTIITVEEYLRAEHEVRKGIVSLPPILDTARPTSDERSKIDDQPQSHQQGLELVTAAAAGELETVDSILLVQSQKSSFTVDPNFQEPINGETALMKAAANGFFDICVHLCKESLYPVDLNVEAYYTKMTALMKAAQNGHLSVVKFLLIGVTFIRKRGWARSSDDAPSQSNSDKPPDESFYTGANPKQVDSDGWNCLHYAASKGHWHIVDFLLGIMEESFPQHENRYFVFSQTKLNETPLILAANNGYLSVVRSLISYMQLKNILRPPGRTNYEEREAKIKDDIGGDEDEDEEDEKSDEMDDQELQLQLKDEQEANEEDEDNVDDLDDADLNSLQEKLKKVARNTNDKKDASHSNFNYGIDQIDSKGKTALLSAAFYGQVYVVHYLVSMGADPEKKDSQGHSAKKYGQSINNNNEHSLSALSAYRYGKPITAPQIAGAIRAGLSDWKKSVWRKSQKKESPHHLKEQAILRLKRAERYYEDGISIYSPKQPLDRSNHQIDSAIFYLLCSISGISEGIKTSSFVLEQELEIKRKAEEALVALIRKREEFFGELANLKLNKRKAIAEKFKMLAVREFKQKHFSVALEQAKMAIEFCPELDCKELLSEINRATHKNPAGGAAAAPSKEQIVAPRTCYNDCLIS